MSTAFPNDDRPRLGLIDVFALVTAMAVAVAILKAAFEATAPTIMRLQSQSSFRRTPLGQPEAPLVWDAELVRAFAMLAVPAGLALSMPLALATQYLGRGRQMPPTRLELIGMTPGFLFLSLAGLVSTARAEHFQFLLAGVLVLIFAAFSTGLWCFWCRSGGLGTKQFAWTDGFGVATLICSWAALILLMGSLR